jgi:hypothetical protein
MSRQASVLLVPLYACVVVKCEVSQLRHCGVVGLLCIMELLTDVQELEWLLALFIKLLHSTLGVDDWFVRAPLLVGACKASAILGMSRSGKHASAVTKAIKDALRSPHNAMRQAACAGLVYMVDGGMEPIYKTLLPLILHHVTTSVKQHRASHLSSPCSTASDAALPPVVSSAHYRASTRSNAQQQHLHVQHTVSASNVHRNSTGDMQPRGRVSGVESRQQMLAWSLAETLILNCSAARVTFATDVLEAAFQQLYVADGVPEVCQHGCVVVSRIMASGVLSDAQVQIVDVILSLSPRDVRTRLALITVSISRIYAADVADQSAPKCLFFQLRKATAWDASALVQVLPAVLVRFLPREARCLLVLSELFTEATHPSPRAHLILSIAQVLSAPALIELKKRKKTAVASPGQTDCTDTVSLIAKFVASTIVRACQEQKTCASACQALLCLFLALSPSPHLRALLHGLDLHGHVDVPPDKHLLAYSGAEFLLQDCMRDATFAEVRLHTLLLRLHPCVAL